MRLPSHGTAPLRSPEFSGEDGSAQDVSKRLRTWAVPSLAFAPAEAVRLLAGLPEAPTGGVRPGVSIAYWAEATKLSLELLVRGLFFPGVAEVHSRGLRAVWSPVLNEGDVPRRLRLLAEAMPPVCRALDGRKNRRRPTRLVQGFLQAAVDAGVRATLKGSSLLPTPERRRRQPAGLAERWLGALTSDDPGIVAPSGELAVFLREVREWTGRLAPPAPRAAFRTCFRLEPPEEPGTPLPGRRQSPPWVVSFHLQALDDPSLLVDARRVWEERSDALAFLRHRFENPQERLLADLGRACQLLPPLETSLRSPRPMTCELSTEEAYAFLQEWGPLLEQSGFGVQVPSWWGKAAARPGLRLRVKSPQGGKEQGAGLLGLDSLVEFHWQVALGDETVGREELERLAALKVPLVRLRGQWVELRPEEVERALRLLQEQGDLGSLGEALRLGLEGESPERGLPIVAFEADGWLRQVIGDLTSEARVEEMAAPESFLGTLRPYQVKGLAWLAFLDRFGLGACLADDMGLGKTIQLIALLLHERADGRKTGATLLVAPTSVVGNWQHELARFAPSLKVLVHHGGERLTGAAFARAARRHDLVISTYALAHRDLAHLAAVSWHRIVLDEAQSIKNPAARQTQALRAMRAPRRVALTGTPVENRLTDLWSIMQFLNPGYLGSGEAFRRSFAIPIEKYRDAGRRDQLRRLVQPFILRRLKTDPAVIQDLPEKLEARVFCHLTREQASLYEAVLQEMLGQIEGAEGIGRKGLVLATLTKLKQVCNHPALFLRDGSALGDRSGKLLRLVEMLEEVVAAGDRGLVFTQFAEMGRLLKGHLQEALTAEVLFLHGGTPRKARDELVGRFQAPQGPSIFVLSLKAGGLGLNLTAASHVFHFDRWWNPAVENQATDRAFRIGQRKNVQVYKYVCAGTMEERIDQLIEQKKELAESVVGTGEGWLTALSTDQLRQLFTLSRDAVREE